MYPSPRRHRRYVLLYYVFFVYDTLPISQQYGWFSPGNSGFHPYGTLVLPCDTHHLTAASRTARQLFYSYYISIFHLLFLPRAPALAHPLLYVTPPPFLNKMLFGKINNPVTDVLSPEVTATRLIPANDSVLVLTPTDTDAEAIFQHGIPDKLEAGGSPLYYHPTSEPSEPSFATGWTIWCI